MTSITKDTVQGEQGNEEDQAELSGISEIIEDVRAGKPVIIVDSEDRENEGDLVIAAQMATPETINFMAKEGRGLICLPMERAMVDRLGLEQMGRGDNSRHRTAFTVSIEAKEGVTTGISAADRAHTIQTAINPESGPLNIATPGHVFPLQARDGGVLVRAGHTEAAVDLAKLAGFSGAGVICEIMNDDGTMARLPDLIEFARRHGLKVGAISDLIAWRRRNESLVRRIHEGRFESHCGDFEFYIYANTIQYAEHIALVKGNLPAPEEQDKNPVTVRMHALDFFGDILKAGQSKLHRAMEIIQEEECGVIVIIREPNPQGLSQRVMKNQDKGQKAGPGEAVLRDYGIGAQILLDLGVSHMRLLTSSSIHVAGLDGYGLEIASQDSLDDVYKAMKRTV